MTLVPVAEQGRERQLGAYAGKIRIKGDLLEPLPEEILNGSSRKPCKNSV